MRNAPRMPTRMAMKSARRFICPFRRGPDPWNATRRDRAREARPAPSLPLLRTGRGGGRPGEAERDEGARRLASRGDREDDAVFRVRPADRALHLWPFGLSTALRADLGFFVELG